MTASWKLRSSVQLHCQLFEAVAIVALGLVLAAAPQAHAQISVSANGRAEYSYPIAVPPGVAGVAPSLSLSYADGGINGPLGVGWSLQGVSVITRCPSSRPVDGVARSVDFSADDRLCLDGQRLVHTDEYGVAAPGGGDASGLGGSSVREFRTETHSWARIRAYGQAGSSLADGPAYFKVWTRSGQVYEYGRNPSDSNDTNALISAQGKSAVMVWAVRRISDVVGNYVNFKYELRESAWGSGSPSAYVGREWNISEIQYTGTSTDAPRNKLVFEYDDRDDVQSHPRDRSEAYQLGSKNLSIRRLRAIRIYINTVATAVPVRTYSLNYEHSSTTGKSRLKTIQECAGPSATSCLPATTFGYRDATVLPAQFQANAAFSASDMARLKMSDTSGNFGILTGDFNGDGLTDILRWSTTPSSNSLFLSTGGGGFIQNPNGFNITADALFSTDGCYKSIVADFNGDGMSDILRTARKSCSGAVSYLFKARGDGGFDKVAVNAAIDFTMQSSVYKEAYSPPGCYPSFTASTTDSIRGRPVRPSVSNTPCNELKMSRTLGVRYFIIDVNGDGYLDIVTTILPPTTWIDPNPEPTAKSTCASKYGGVCTHVYLGDANGNFNETSTNVVGDSLYTAIAAKSSYPYWRIVETADVNGDGLQDILSDITGTWRSLGDGNFRNDAVQDNSQICGYSIDFNGDGRADCLMPYSTASSQRLTLSLGSVSSGSLGQFNLLSSGDELVTTNPSGQQTSGIVIEDFDGDGRQDILRWAQTPSNNGIYFSNGDGSFRTPIAPSGLDGISRPLQSPDGTTGFVLGDFLGTGTVQILHFKQDPPQTGGDASSLNQLYALAGVPGPIDVLASVTTPTGMVHTVAAWQPLTRPSSSGGRYQSDRGTGNAGTGSIVDLTFPAYVVATTNSDSGFSGGGSLATEYFYKGFKAERNGRGPLGFREVRQQRPAPDGSLMTTVTQYLQTFPYIGMPSVVTTYTGDLWSSGVQWLSQTTNAYCEKASASALPEIGQPGTPPAPCQANASGTRPYVYRPYLYQTVEQGKDLKNNSLALPQLKTTQTYNDSGDVLTIKSEITGLALGFNQTVTKLTENTYFSNNTAGDNWILGRLQTSKVTNTVPNQLGSITTSAGTSPHASETQGTGATPAPAPLPPAVLSAILQLLLAD